MSDKELWFNVGSLALIVCCYFCGRAFTKWLKNR